MHDVLRQRLLRKIESLPDEQIYQILDYIEFLESKYAATEGMEASGLQRFAEGLALGRILPALVEGGLGRPDALQTD